MKLTSLFAATLIALPGAAFASTWNIDASHSEVQFKVRHLMISNVKGEFQKFSGVLNFDEKNPSKSTVEVTIDANSVDTGDKKRDDHLRNPDFLDTKKFPTLTFKSTKVTKKKGGFKVQGNLTIHGVTKSVVLDVEGPTKSVKDPWGNTKRGVSATTKISRKDFGLTYNAALETGGVVIGDEVKISIDAELAKAK